MKVAPPTRFLIGVIALYSGTRVALVRPWAVLAPITAPVAALANALLGGPPAAASRPTGAQAGPAPVVSRPRPAPPLLLAAAAAPTGPDAPSTPPSFGRPGYSAASSLLLAASTPGSIFRRATGPVLAPVAPPPPAADPKRWSGYAYAFVRQGSAGAALSPGGQLGGSQAGARIAYRLDHAGHVALAARASLPLEDARGAELAFGADLHPWPALPVRFSLERRVALGRDARDAWSAYAAGGFFKGLGRGFEVDGYAQAGVVGVHARDLFADGAVRLGRRWTVGSERSVVVGGGVWAAAQPGVERLDIGPRAALSGKLDQVPVTLALEGRFRVAGHAAPGSGIALTLASDF